jgi:branched-chain amino acid transport system ATP-binding protein
MSLLNVSKLEAGYEPGLLIVKGASIHADKGEIVVILGPNGAGKSSLIKAIAGLVPVSGGQVTLAGEDITAIPAHLKIRKGLAFVPQTDNIFPLMTVEENLAVAAGVFRDPAATAHIDEMFTLFPDLARQRRLAAGSLSGGQRQMLACARALIVRPGVLMLDEPSAGLSPKFVEQVFARLVEIRATGVTIVLVEQNARAALAIGDRAYVLVEGREAHEGPARTLWDNPLIAELYLGHRKEGAA